MYTDSMQDKLVSIIIPTYNRANLISETLDSVLAQTYYNWECIIVDDGSTDKTQELVLSYIKTDARFRYFKRPIEYKKGGNGARNFGFKMCKGEYLVFLDSDDVLLPKALERRVKNMKAHLTDLIVCESGVFESRIEDTTRLWNNVSDKSSSFEFLIRFFNKDMPWQTAGVTWSKNFFEFSEGWNSNLRAWQDWDMHSRALIKNPSIYVQKGELDNYYRHFTDNGISSFRKNKNYLLNIEKAIESVHTALISNPEIYKNTKYQYLKLIYNMLIKYPISLQYRLLPFSFLLHSHVFKDISRLNFLKVLVIELLGTSFKVRKYILGSIYKKQQASLMLRTTHLKKL